MPITCPFSTNFDDTCIKIMVHRALSDKTYSSLGLLSPLIKARNTQLFQRLCFYEQLKFYAQISWAWRKFYNLEARGFVFSPESVLKFHLSMLIVLLFLCVFVCDSFSACHVLVCDCGNPGHYHLFNPFMPNVFSDPYQLDESIFVFRVVGCYFFLFLFKFLKKFL